jgi:4-phytase/acid phosphatase
MAGLAGLLGLHWTLQGYQTDFTSPGGALVFELRQSNKSKEYLVRAFYTSQTFDQLRNLTPLTFEAPPATMQLMVPGGSNSATDLDVMWPIFKKLLSGAIDQKCVQPYGKEVPPGVLTNVPQVFVPNYFPVNGIRADPMPSILTP